MRTQMTLSISPTTNISKRHQKQALTFMLNRERGWDLDESSGDLWHEIIDKGRCGFVFDKSLLIYKLLRYSRYINKIRGDAQECVPVQFRGGLLADPMGLGKMLSTIALIASDRTPNTRIQIPLSGSNTFVPLRNTTLLIVPSIRKSALSR